MNQGELLTLSRIYNLIGIIEKRLDIILEMQEVISENIDSEAKMKKLEILLNLNKKL